MIKAGDRIISKKPIEVITYKQVKGVVYKTEKNKEGETLVYFVTEDNRLKCFKINEVELIEEENIGGWYDTSCRN